MRPAAFMHSFNQFMNSRKALVMLSLLATFKAIWVLVAYGFVYSDIDQNLLWAATQDLAEGRYYEPNFYGQNYLPLIEPVLAVPLVTLGLSPQYALPIISTVLFHIPLLMLLMFNWRKNVQACLMICAMWIALPIEFFWISGMPRGFMIGIGLAAFGLIPLFKPGKLSLFMGWIMMGIGAIANPNALILVGPIGLILLVKNWTSLITYASIAAAGLFAFILNYFIKLPYVNEPERIAHTPINMSWSFDRWIEAIGRMDPLIGNVVPWLNYQSAFLILLILTISVGFMRQKNWLMLTVSSVFLLGLLYTLGLNKVHDGGTNIFLPYTRMFLAVPMVLLLLLARSVVNSALLTLLTCGSIVTSLWQFSVAHEKYMYYFNKKSNQYALAITNEKLCSLCNRLDDLAKTHDASALIIGLGPLEGRWNMAYGCEVLQPGLPIIVDLKDRRIWRLREVNQATYSRVIIIAGYSSWLEQVQKNHPGYSWKLIDEEAHAYLLSGNLNHTLKLFKDPSNPHWYREF